MSETLPSKRNLRKQYKYIILLSMIYLVGWTTTYPMIYKMTDVHNILESGCIYLFPLSYAVADIISEVYGYRIARQIVWFSIICGFIYALALYIIGTMPGPHFWHKQTSYETVFSPLLRAYFATTIASVLGNFVNIYIISRWKVILKGRVFWARSLLSTGIGELLFSVIGGTMAYAGVEPWSKIVFLMLDGYAFKMLYACIAVWPVVLIVILLRKAEKVDVYDIDINYNPFKLSLD